MATSAQEGPVQRVSRRILCLKEGIFVIMSHKHVRMVAKLGVDWCRVGMGGGVDGGTGTVPVSLRWPTITSCAGSDKPRMKAPICGQGDTPSMTCCLPSVGEGCAHDVCADRKSVPERRR